MAASISLDMRGEVKRGKGCARGVFRASCLGLLLLLAAGCGGSDEELPALEGPGAPVASYEEIGDDLSAWRIELTWEEVPGVENYRVRFYVGEPVALTNDMDLPPEDNATDIDTDEPRVSFGPLARGEKIAFRVVSVRSDGRLFGGQSVWFDLAPVVADAALNDCMKLALASLQLASGPDPDEPLTWSDLRRVECDEAGVASLRGVGIASGLTSLILSGNSIEDIGPLGELAQLEELLLDGNAVSDLSPLAGASKLSLLTLQGNPVTSLAPLAALSALESVALGDHPQLPDLSDLPSGLLGLDIAGDAPVAPLQRFTALTTLSLQPSEDRSGEVSLSAIRTLAHLEVLIMSDVESPDLSWLPEAPISFLAFLFGGLSDISALLSRAELSFVSLEGNPDIPCAQLDALEAALGPEGSLVRPDSCAE